MADDNEKLKKEHEEKYMKYLGDWEACGGDCSTCGGDCSACGSSDEKTPKKAGRILAVFSGKGGTGKSLVTCLLADALQRRGNKVAVLDADLENPSIHYLYGKMDPCRSDDKQVFPVQADSGVEFLSMGNVEEKREPLLWYGKDIAVGALYFYTNAGWSSDLDFMLVDMPSGIGDVPLQLGTIIPFDGSILVSNPSDLCDSLAGRSVALMRMIRIPVLGVVENKTCLPVADGEIALGGDPAAHAEALSCPLLGSVPLRLELAAMADFGRVSEADVPELAPVVDRLLS